MDAISIMDNSGEDHSNNSSEDDDEFIQFIALIAFPRKAEIVCKRRDHFKFWTETEFVSRFQMRKDTVQFLLPD